MCRHLALSLACLLTAAGAGADWPHWRGPARDGTSPETGLPLRWSAEQGVAWKLPLPDLSGSTPVLWGDRLFLSVASGDRLELWCVNRGDGTVAWQRSLGSGNEKKRKGNLSSPSPVTDGSGVWVMTGTGVLKGFDFAGRELWSRDLQAEFGPFGVLHGYSSSPLLVGDALIVQVLHGFLTDDPSYLLAVDKRSGATRWRVERPTDAPREAPDAYTTPTLLGAGADATLVISGADYVTGHDPATGREIWRLPGLNPTANPAQRIVASPIAVGDMIYVPSRVAPLLAIRTRGEAPPEVVWQTDRGPDVPTPAVDATSLYILTDLGIVWRLDRRTGAVLWGPERVSGGTYSASPVVADGRLYVTAESGKTTVLRAGGDFEILSENDLAEYTLSSLAISDGQIFQRTAEHLYCFGERGSGNGR